LLCSAGQWCLQMLLLLPLLLLPKPVSSVLLL
jgi:hypothetical protein